MAIGLATAIGLGGKLQSENSGVAEIIRQTGEGISGSIRQAGSGVSAGLQTIKAKEAEMDKGRPPSISTNIMAGEKQREEYTKAAVESNTKVQNAYEQFKQGKMPKGEYTQLMTTELSRLKNMKDDFESDFKTISEDIPKINPDEFDISETRDALTGRRISRPKAIKQGEGESGKDQIGFEEEIIKPYFDLSYEEQRKLYPMGLKSLVSKARPIGATFSDGWKDFFGSADLDSFVEEKIVDGPTGLKQQTFRVKSEEANNALNQFLGSKNTNLSPKSKKYFRTLEVQADRVGREMGLEGEQLKFFVDTQVDRLATEDFQRSLLEAERKKKEKILVDLNPENEGKGMTITFGAGGSMSAGNTKVAKVTGTPAQSLTDTKEKISDYKKQLNETIDELTEAERKNNTLKKKLLDKKKEILESTIKTLENLPSDVNEYYILSAQDNINEGKLEFTDEENNVINMSPSVFYKKGGEWMIGGTADVIEEDKKVSEVMELPINDNNLKMLTTNKKGFEVIWNKINEPSAENKPASKAPATSNTSGKKETFSEYLGRFEAKVGRKATKAEIEHYKKKFNSK